MILRFNINTIIKNTINKIFLIYKILLIIYIDFKSLYNCLIKFDIINKKRLIINIIFLYKSYEHRKINKIQQIDKHNNLADTLIKKNLN